MSYHDNSVYDNETPVPVSQGYDNDDLNVPSSHHVFADEQEDDFRRTDPRYTGDVGGYEESPHAAYDLEEDDRYPDEYPDGEYYDDDNVDHGVYRNAHYQDEDDEYAAVGTGVPYSDQPYSDQPYSDQPYSDQQQAYYDNPEEENPGVFVAGAPLDPHNRPPEDTPLKRQDGQRHLLRRRRRKKQKYVLTEEEKRRRRRRLWWLLCCCLCLLLLLLLIGGVAMGLKGIGDDDEGGPVEEDDDIPDDDWQLFRPYLGRVTTPMDPYEEDDCYFGDNVFPHMIQQCECFGTIDVIPEDVQELYAEVREDINQEFYNGEFSEDMNSCDPANQALIWLSSGNTRDGGDLFQRFTVALTFVQLNGTQWDLKNLWLADDSECIWLGLQCNGRFQLNSLAVDTNNVHGSFPSEVARLDGLKQLSITRNHLTGTIPTELFSMKNLEHLLLYANQMRGSIPTHVGLATHLRTLRLENNLFFGSLVSQLGQATSLEEFSIGFNTFWRKIPTEMGELTNMRSLVMEENRFSGILPTEFGRFSNLEYFLISENLMTGPIPLEFTNLSNLQEFRIAGSGVGGVFPTELGPVMTSLHRLELGENNFVGTIMTEFGLMTSMSWLALNGNDFKGKIPTEFGNLVNMTRLSLQDTLITGVIPTELGRMTRLENLVLDKNGITGHAPEEVCKLRDLLLDTFVTDCPARGDAGVVCPIPDCCTFCRRGESSN